MSQVLRAAPKGGGAGKASSGKSKPSSPAVSTPKARTTLSNAPQFKVMGAIYPENKTIQNCLHRNLYGVGQYTASRICAALGINPLSKIRDLPLEIVPLLRQELEKNWLIDQKLKEKIASNLQVLVDINCYRGLRHRGGLPVRGQRTKTNAFTAKTLAIQRLKFFGVNLGKRSGMAAVEAPRKVGWQKKK